VSWLLVLVFAGSPPSAHVYYEFTADKGPECHKLAESFNAQPLKGRTAVCVPWTTHPKGFDR
jgi:hypothetical protein